MALSRQCPVDDEPDIHVDTVALHSDSRHAASLDELIRHIADGQDHSIRHDAVSVSPNMLPFKDETTFTLFVEVLSHLREASYTPPGLLVHDDEWGEEEYPITEVIAGGIRGKKPIELDLPPDIWYPRAILWAQSLTAMRHVLAHTHVYN